MLAGYNSQEGDAAFVHLAKVFDRAADHIGTLWDEYFPRRIGRRSAANNIVADRVAFGKGTDMNLVAIVDQTFETAVGRAAHYYGSVLERKLPRIAAPSPSEVEQADSMVRVWPGCTSEMRQGYGLDYDRKVHSSRASVA